MTMESVPCFDRRTYESHAQEKYLANIRQVPITWNIVRCTRTVLTGLRAISLGYHNLNGVGWVLTCFDFDRSCIESWAHSCARRRETSLTRSSTEWMQAPWLLPVVLEQRAVGHEFAPRWWARNGPASVPASACLHPAWFVFVLGVLVTSRDHWWNTDSFSFTQAEEPPVRQQPVYAQRHELRGLCGGCDGLVTACYGMLRLCFLFFPIHHSSNPVL